MSKDFGKDEIVESILNLRQTLLDKPGRWENHDLISFLQALGSVIDTWSKIHTVGLEKELPQNPDWLFLYFVLGRASTEVLSGMPFDKEEFVEQILNLRQALFDEPEKWENHTLVSFLQILGNITDSLPQTYRMIYGTELPVNPNWQLFASILSRTSIYE